MRRGLFLILAVTMSLGACKPTIHMPLHRRVVQICAADSQIISKVRQEASRLSLEYNYSTHVAPYGRQMFFLLAGEGFEVELWNAFERQNYELRVFLMKPGTDDQATSVYTNFMHALTTDPVLACAASQGPAASNGTP